MFWLWLREARSLLGRPFPFRSWAEWANEHPVDAALQLEMVARVFEARATTRKRPDGWLARWDRTLALALSRQALALRRAARGEQLQRVCSVRPGLWTEPLDVD